MVYGFGRSRLKRVGDDNQFRDVFPEVKPIPTHTLQGNDAFFPMPRPSSERSFKDHVMCRVFSEDYDAAGSGILDPRGETIRRWSRTFFVASLLSLFVDPVFFYIPQVDDSNQVCMEENTTVKAVLR